MLSREGDKATVKVLDFGLAKATREEKVDGGLTTEGQALGTPDYIAPEQILDAPSADIRADIYSLGGTLYYLLTGRPPFQAKSLYDLYQAHISRDADPLNLVRPEVPVELAALVAKMMAKEPSRRFQTPGEVAQALTPFFKKGNVALRDPERTSPRGPDERRDVPGASRGDPAGDGCRPAGGGSQKAAGPSVAEPRWESMIEFREPETAAEAAQEVAPRRRTRWPLLVAAAVFGVVLLGVIIVRRGQHEDLRVEYEPIRNNRATASRERSPEAATEARNRHGFDSSAKADHQLDRHEAGADPGRRVPDGLARFGQGRQDDEKPQHRVRITRPFYLGATEVTQGQYRAVTGQSPSYFKGSDDLPVEQVSWNDAIAFCDKLSELEKGQLRRVRRLPAADGGGMGVCLPGGEHDPVQLRRRRGEPGRVCLV